MEKEQEARAALADGKVILAMKILRDANNIPLIDAKDIVEGWQAVDLTKRIFPPGDPRAPFHEPLITRDQWLERCAAVFRTKAAMEPDLAMQYAESNLENVNNDLSESPEQAAQDEMENWTAD